MKDSQLNIRIEKNRKKRLVDGIQKKGYVVSEFVVIGAEEKLERENKKK